MTTFHTDERTRSMFLALLADHPHWDAVAIGLNRHAHEIQKKPIPEDELDEDPEWEAWCREQDRKTFATVYAALDQMTTSPAEAVRAVFSLNVPFFAPAAEYLGMAGRVLKETSSPIADEFYAALAEAYCQKTSNTRRMCILWLNRAGFVPSQTFIDRAWLAAFMTGVVDTHELSTLTQTEWRPSPSEAARIAAAPIPRPHMLGPENFAVLNRALLDLAAAEDARVATTLKAGL